MAFWIVVSKVPFKLSALPLLCGWYGAGKTCSTLNTFITFYHLRSGFGGGVCERVCQTGYPENKSRQTRTNSHLPTLGSWKKST
ncbi:hypothetical protein GDO78_017061 [Eleutherodactylus coqui]|uniref:Uncharacterized protein n=1 Tax=Eleutherodactylus coqui TaxID=57060 RepID=A0A8J6E3J9_ELECQ|nr:hypothetical protein GDO78_017061 [Eleutherodactylus coqui]